MSPKPETLREPAGNMNPLSGEREGKPKAVVTERKPGDEGFEFPWWVKAYPSMVKWGTGSLFLLIALVTILWSQEPAFFDALDFCCRTYPVMLLLDQTTFFLANRAGKNPVKKPILTYMGMFVTITSTCTLYAIQSGGIDKNWLPIVLIVVIRDTFAIFMFELDRVVSEYPHQEADLRIYDTVTPYKDKKFEALSIILNIPFQDGLTVFLAIWMGFAVPLTSDWNHWTAYLLPAKLFLTDILNDAGYYALHTTLHQPKYYKHHKLHHLVKHPTSWCAGLMSFSEMFETFVITRILTPFVFSLIFGKWTIPEFMIYNCYMGMLEVGGHSGNVGGLDCSTYCGTSFFAYIFDIKLEITHHDLHHELFNVNFSKRTSLFDKLFGTFLDAKHKVPSYEGGSKIPRNFDVTKFTKRKST